MNAVYDMPLALGAGDGYVRPLAMPGDPHEPPRTPGWVAREAREIWDCVGGPSTGWPPDAANPWSQRPIRHAAEAWSGKLGASSPRWLAAAWGYDPVEWPLPVAVFGHIGRVGTCLMGGYKTAAVIPGAMDGASWVVLAINDGAQPYIHTVHGAFDEVVLALLRATVSEAFPARHWQVEQGKMRALVARRVKGWLALNG